jgi:hypothetical protein
VGGGRFADISRNLHARVKQFFDAPLGADATPLEISQAVLDDVERKVQPVGRGRRVFPYSAVIVRVGPLEMDRPALEGAFAPLEARVRDRLVELRCESPGVAHVKVVFMKKAPAHWAAGQVFAVEYSRAAETAASPQPANTPPSVPPVHITVVKGAATKRAYTFTDAVIAIGRTSDPTDELGRVRRNLVAFGDAVDGITETVGRAHARLKFDAATRAFRLYDDGSSNGTSIAREGMVIHVAPRDPQGVRVQSGDELHIGRAILRLAIDL